MVSEIPLGIEIINRGQHFLNIPVMLVKTVVISYDALMVCQKGKGQSSVS